MLDLLAVIWKSDSTGSLNRETLSSFVCYLIARLSTDEETRSPMQTNVLTALACLEGASNMDVSEILDKKSWDNEKIWLLAMRSEPTDLLNSGRSV